MPAKNATDLMEIWVTNLLDFYFLNYWVLGSDVSNAPKNVKEMEKWVGELSTELSLV